MKSTRRELRLILPTDTVRAPAAGRRSDLADGTGPELGVAPAGSRWGVAL